MFTPQLFQSAASTGSPDYSTWVSSASSNESTSGIYVSPETAMKYSAVYSCVTILAESIAQLPCELYRRTKNGGREKATDHPLYNVIRHQPNKKDTAFEFYEQGQGCIGMRGNHYSLIERDSNAHVKELIPIHPDKMGVLKGPDGLPYYHLIEQNETLPMRMVHHVKSFSFNGYTGVSPIQVAANTIGLAIATDEHASRVFLGGTAMAGVIERPKEVATIDSQEKIDKILAKWTERHSGLRNFFKVAMLQEGMTYKQLAMKNEEAQLLESRKFGVEEIARLYKIPRHFIQDSNGQNFNTTEQMGLVFVMYTLMSHIKRREAAMMRDLVLPEERAKYYIEFNVSSLLRGDQKGRYEAYAIARQWGWLSVNDIRRLENMPPLKSGGDVYLTPLNMVDTNGKPLVSEKKRSKIDSATPEQLKEIEAIINAKAD